MAKRRRLAPEYMSDKQLWDFVEAFLAAVEDPVHPYNVDGPERRRMAHAARDCAIEIRMRGVQLQLHYGRESR